jgi:hypothetical protein
VRHATPADLDPLSGLLADLRRLDGLKERTPGSFYVKSRGFLHFHVDGDDLYADVKLDGVSFDRRRVTSPQEQQRLLATIRSTLGAG